MQIYYWRQVRFKAQTKSRMQAAMVRTCDFSQLKRLALDRLFYKLSVCAGKYSLCLVEIRVLNEDSFPTILQSCF